MSNATLMRLPFSPVRALSGLALFLVLSYIALIAFVMSSAALTVSFSESVRDDQAAVAMLETTYFNSIATISNSNYTELGYNKPVAEIFVPGRPATALR